MSRGDREAPSVMVLVPPPLRAGCRSGRQTPLGCRWGHKPHWGLGWFMAPTLCGAGRGCRSGCKPHSGSRAGSGRTPLSGRDTGASGAVQPHVRAGPGANPTGARPRYGLECKTLHRTGSKPLRALHPGTSWGANPCVGPGAGGNPAGSQARPWVALQNPEWDWDGGQIPAGRDRGCSWAAKPRVEQEKNPRGGERGGGR